LVLVRVCVPTVAGKEEESDEVTQLFPAEAGAAELMA